MTKKTRRNHSPAFKSKVALAALKGEKTIAQLADQFGIHVSQVSDWKEQLLAGAADLFEARGGGKPSASEIDVKSLHAKIGGKRPARAALLSGSRSVIVCSVVSRWR